MQSKKLKDVLFYILFIGGLSILIWVFLNAGAKKEALHVTHPTVEPEVSNWIQFKSTYAHNITNPLAILLLQIITIIAVARVFGFFCVKIRQPSVIGEIAAGIFLGPSVVGLFFPEFSAFLFPKNSLSNLQFLSQIGLILFMFVVGMELDLKILKKKAQDAVIISHASIVFPFVLGVGLAYFMYDQFAPTDVKFLPFALFTGVAVSITAFPVLARIVQERGLSKTKLGSIVITCAAADDITAWCILAAIIAIVKAGSFVSAFYAILFSGGYILIMLKVIRPFLKKIADIYAGKEGLSKPIVAVFFLTLLLSSYATEVIGIHALFGAFMAGVIMPQKMSFKSIFIEKVEDVSLVLLLPLFFVFTGLRTQIGLINEGGLWLVCLAVIGVAVTGKFLGSAIAAKFVGQSWRDSLVIGALMNTRGLMELVVLNIGYDLGLLSTQVFSMMVIMALVTTFMTGPLLDLINFIFPERKNKFQVQDAADHFNVLISFGNPQKGKLMLRLANALVRTNTEEANVTALHFSPSTELNQYNIEEYEKENFLPIRAEAKKLNLPVTTMFKGSGDIEKEIVSTVNQGKFDLLMVGMGRSVFEGTLLGKILGFTTKFINPDKLYDTITGKEKLLEESLLDDRTKYIVKHTTLPLAIFVDKNLSGTKSIIAPVMEENDVSILPFLQKFILNNNSEVTLLGMTPQFEKTHDYMDFKNALGEKGKKILFKGPEFFNKQNIEAAELVLLSFDSWKHLVTEKSEMLHDSPSLLIVRA
jgi:Kef-type K+ transport system membrane component KefB